MVNRRKQLKLTLKQAAQYLSSSYQVLLKIYLRGNALEHTSMLMRIMYYVYAYLKQYSNINGSLRIKLH